MVKEEMEVAFSHSAQKLDKHLQDGDTTEYWYEWSACVETAFVKARCLDKKEERLIRGRGHVAFEEFSPFDEVTHLKDVDVDEWTQLRKGKSRPFRERQRCVSI